MDENFANRLKLLRKQKNLSQAELGKLVNIHYNHIGRYERGDSRPSADTLHKLADVLGVSSDYLLEGETKEAIKAKFEDVALLKMFQKSEHLPENDKMVIKSLLDAFLFKHEVQSLTR